MASKTLLRDVTPNMRRLHDQAIMLSGRYRAFNNVTFRRYSVVEDDYKDKKKTLLETITGLDIYLEYPGDISNLSRNVTFIEDVLPLTVLLPWHKCDGTVFKCDIWDEFDITLETEFGEDKTYSFELVDRQSTYEEQHVYREFIVAPKRNPEKTDITDTDDDGVVDDPNIRKVEESDYDIFSEYD